MISPRVGVVSYECGVSGDGRVVCSSVLDFRSIGQEI
jgi:hypothetical protein